MEISGNCHCASESSNSIFMFSSCISNGEKKQKTNSTSLQVSETKIKICRHKNAEALQSSKHYDECAPTQTHNECSCTTVTIIDALRKQN